MCSLCDNTGETRHIDIHAFGNEGLEVCAVCEAEITEHCRAMARRIIIQEKWRQVFEIMERGGITLQEYDGMWNRMSKKKEVK